MGKNITCVFYRPNDKCTCEEHRWFFGLFQDPICQEGFNHSNCKYFIERIRPPKPKRFPGQHKDK